MSGFGSETGRGPGSKDLRRERTHHRGGRARRPARSDLAALLAALLLTAACESLTETEVSETGTMVFENVDAPCWLIDTGETRYLPINLPDEYEVEGLRVRFEARRTAGSTVCGGFVIELTSIERI